MANENELEIILSLQDKVTKEFDGVVSKMKKGTKEIEGGFKDIEKTSDKTNETVIDGVKGQQKEMVSFLRIFTRVGFIWGLTGGLIIKSIVDIGKEIDNLDKLSIKLGISTEELSMKFYGFNIATIESRTGAMATNNALKNLGDTFMALKVGIAEVIGENAILQKQFGIMGTGNILTGLLPEKMSREEAIKAIQEENRMKRLSSKEGQAIWLEEENMFRQLTMSKVDYTKWQFEQQISLMEWYGKDTKNLQEAFMTRRAQDEEMELMRLSAVRLTAQGNETAAMEMEFDRQLMAYKRVWGEDGEVVKTYINTQKILQDKKATEIILKNISGISSALGTLESALAMAGETNKGFAKTAAAISLAMAIIYTAEGIMRAYKDYPWPISSIVAGIVAAAGAIQVATIAAQKFATGGPVGLQGPELIMVGERGPEYVTPNHELGKMGQQISISIEINNPQVKNYDDIDILTEEISKRLSREIERA